MVIKRSIFSSLFVIIIAILISTSSYTISAERSSGIIAPGATIKKVQSGFTFTEGPAADTEGNIYFTDIPNEKIFKWSHKDGSITLYREGTGQANGLMFDGKGRLVVCEMGNNRVTLDDMKGDITVLADNYKGKKLNMPNDLWIDPRGGIYFSDFLGPGSTESRNEKLQIYYIPPDNRDLIRVTDDLVAPNGLIGTPDGKSLYVADMGVKKTWKYKILSDGTLIDKKEFCDQGSDGMSLDEKGNVYVTGDAAIYVYNPEGKKIEEIAFPERPSNMSFGGKERKTLFITAMTSIYTLDMTVRGALTPLDLAGENISP
jgi:gluconolactonase